VIKALVFDVFGTLFDWRGSLIDSFEAFEHERGLAADWPALVEAWRAAYAPSMDLVRHGRLPWTNLDALHRASLDELAPRFGLAGLEESARAECVQFWHRLEPWPDVRAGMARLRERFTVATLSNGNVALLVDLARHADIRFDALFSAEIFRHYKPDPETYRGAAELLGIGAEELMLVAAHNADLRAAAACGLRTAFLARCEWGPRQVSDLTAEDGIDVAARDLFELAERLGG